jgi:hypothetical protein
MLYAMSVPITQLRSDTWERVVRAVDLVIQRLNRAAAALSSAGVPFAVAGGNAVAAWVAQIDEEAVRATKDVDLVVRRVDFDRVKQALQTAGFVYRHAAGLDMFLDGPDGSPRSAIHLLFAREKVNDTDILTIPDPSESEVLKGKPVLSLDALVRNKLNAFRRKDQTHLDDFLELGLIDESWLQKLEPPLAERLKRLIDNPE